MPRQSAPMRLTAFAALLLAPALAHAQAAAQPDDSVQTTDDVRSATAACLSAVIDDAPVGDVTVGDISIHRGQDPASCTVTVSGGQPVLMREAMLAAITRREELFKPAKTRWDPEGFASRETFCNLSLRKNYNVVVSTAKPGSLPVAVATVLASPKRDDRCDRDLSVQQAAAANLAAKPAGTAQTAAAPPASTDIKTIAATPKPPPKEGWLRKVTGLHKRKD